MYELKVDITRDKAVWKIEEPHVGWVAIVGVVVCCRGHWRTQRMQRGHEASNRSTTSPSPQQAG